ncbi:alanine racemase [Nocardioides sp.]|uniref:alanine racemase n=1 Tax=Nocardioides sp. TaxID=35761 RepID=UPI00352938AE
MSLTLTVDGERWRRHLRDVAAARPGLVPVAKGNGYGFGLGRLARKTQWLAEHPPEGGTGPDTLAVGTYPELAEVAQRFAGDLLVLTPWRPFTPALDPALARRVVHTVSRPEDLAGLLDREPGARFVLERLTSMRRHGLTAAELREVAASAPARQLAGVALHLPLGDGSQLEEVQRLMVDVVAAGLEHSTVWVSHLGTDELAALRSAYPATAFRPRVGTALWLGDRDALRATATVLDVHRVTRGERYGYRGRRAPRAGHLLVVSGGTAHGIGLVAPTGDLSLRARAASVARGGLDAAGLARSPFLVAGRQAMFAEPPHMQASMLFLPDSAAAPAVGDQLEVRVRFTATAFDAVEIV